MAEKRRDARRDRQWVWIVGILLYIVGQLGFQELMRRGIITWPWALSMAVGLTAVGLAVGRYVVIPRLSRKESVDPRISRTDSWESPLDPSQALARIDRALRDQATELTVSAETLHVRMGSDEVYRVKGSASDKGWAALPLAATFRVEPHNAGSLIHAEARDDLGWYAAPPQPFVENEVQRRAATLIRRTGEATRGTDAPA
ncbi:hypothetical protein [Kocuria sp.]|uniref:hypothetical protein n=1 Tax=Kocuria sp. TaxID=1871328 RepID=UPI0026DAEA3C|nr:hypothetical protein [Kocuria sp.]MDO4918505.1 hypothetical protein [Kocuria sp.]